MQKTGLIFKALMIFVFSVFLLVSCNIPHIDGPQPGWGDIENLVLSIDGDQYQGAEVPTVLAMLFVQKELKANGNDTGTEREQNGNRPIKRLKMNDD